MNNKKIKICVIVLSAAALAGTVSFYSKADNSMASLMSAVGNVFNQHASDDSDSDKEIFARGKNGIVTNSEVKQAKDFYVLSGMSETDAQTKAENYMMQREALYQKAVKEGYRASEKEIKAYIEELKSVINSSKNKEDAQAVINQFDSEEKYWEYEYSVYEKDLPIQNYVKDLETQFRASNISTHSDTAVDSMDDQWNQYLEQMKSDVTHEEAFEKLN